jgi:diguanylate cyclase (GGDEF)-like protein
VAVRSAARHGVIAVLRSGEDASPLLGRQVEVSDDERVRVVNAAELSENDPAQPLAAVICPITRTTDALPASVRRLRDGGGGIPVLSYSADSGDEELREVSRNLGCASHLEGPLSVASLAEVVRRERQLTEANEALRRTREEARREHEKLTHLIEIIKTANSVLEPSRVMEVVMEKARDSLRSELWCLFLLDERHERLVFERAGHGLLRSPKEYGIAIGEGIEGAVFQARRPLIVNAFPEHPCFDASFDRITGVESRAVLVVPLISRGRAIGVVKLVNRLPGDAFSPADQSLVTLLMEPAAIALENAILFKKMEQLSVTDDLTGLHNVRYLNGFLYREIKRSRRYRLPVSVVFLDMDGFKTVNDRFGHLAGSQTLVEVGQLLRETVREIDMVARYGGDEFVVVLPQTDPAGAMVIAERIRERIEDTTFLGSMGLKLHLTASLGVASFPDQGRSRDELIHKADAAMYQVKESGKNGVMTAA